MMGDFSVFLKGLPPYDPTGNVAAMEAGGIQKASMVQVPPWEPGAPGYDPFSATQGPTAEANRRSYYGQGTGQLKQEMPLSQNWSQQQMQQAQDIENQFRPPPVDATQANPLGMGPLAPMQQQVP